MKKLAALVALTATAVSFVAATGAGGSYDPSGSLIGEVRSLVEDWDGTGGQDACVKHAQDSAMLHTLPGSITDSERVEAVNGSRDGERWLGDSLRRHEQAGADLGDPAKFFWSHQHQTAEHVAQVEAEIEAHCATHARMKAAYDDFVREATDENRGRWWAILRPSIVAALGYCPAWMN